MCKQEQSAGLRDDGSTLALKPMGRVNQSPKQKVPVAPQNGYLSLQKMLKRNRSNKPVLIGLEEIVQG